jgi:hypothetical protein
MRVLICGSRNWTNKDIIEGYFEWLKDKKPITIVHGDCPTGADWIATGLALKYGYRIEAHPADWQTYGKAAGPIRNKQMVDSGIDLVIAFLRNNSRGTKSTIDLAKEKGIRVIVSEG